jgi:hypothetical protein
MFEVQIRDAECEFRAWGAYVCKPVSRSKDTFVDATNAFVNPYTGESYVSLYGMAATLRLFLARIADCKAHDPETARRMAKALHPDVIRAANVHLRRLTEGALGIDVDAFARMYVPGGTMTVVNPVSLRKLLDVKGNEIFPDGTCPTSGPSGSATVAIATNIARRSWAAAKENNPEGTANASYVDIDITPWAAKVDVAFPQTACWPRNVADGKCSRRMLLMTGGPDVTTLLHEICHTFMMGHTTTLRRPAFTMSTDGVCLMSQYLNWAKDTGVLKLSTGHLFMAGLLKANNVTSVDANGSSNGFLTSGVYKVAISTPGDRRAVVLTPKFDRLVSFVYKGASRLVPIPLAHIVLSCMDNVMSFEVMVSPTSWNVPNAWQPSYWDQKRLTLCDCASLRLPMAAGQAFVSDASVAGVRLPNDAESVRRAIAFEIKAVDRDYVTVSVEFR